MVMSPKRDHRGHYPVPTQAGGKVSEEGQTTRNQSNFKCREGLAMSEKGKLKWSEVIMSIVCLDLVDDVDLMNAVC